MRKRKMAENHEESPPKKKNTTSPSKKGKIKTLQPNNEIIFTLENPPPRGWKLKHIRKVKSLKSKLDRVFLAELKLSKELFVLKRLDHSEQEYPPYSSLLLEKEIHLISNHPCVIRTFGTIETESAVYLMLEHGSGGDLLQHCFGYGEEKKLARHIRDIARGIRYLHSLGIVHRDVKPENVVLTESGRCKLIDFGFSAKLPLNSGRALNDTSRAGTMDYLSPEVIWGQPYDHSIDVWALGVVSYLLLCGHFPFVPHLLEDPRRQDKLAKAIVSGHMHKGPPFFAASRLARDFVENALRESPSDRLTLEEILEHPFLDPLHCESHSPASSSVLSSSSSAEALERALPEEGEDPLTSLSKQI